MCRESGLQHKARVLLSSEWNRHDLISEVRKTEKGPITVKQLEFSKPQANFSLMKHASIRANGVAFQASPSCESTEAYLIVNIISFL